MVSFPQQVAYKEITEVGSFKSEHTRHSASHQHSSNDLFANE